mmetsp:Transcript_25625/g.43702  ORF Transcript_25625/g.43702 Transcript_25625/m.43702 type:complete len:252 (-) Transcript_25625:345-1100(-)
MLCFTTKALTAACASPSVGKLPILSCPTPGDVTAHTTTARKELPCADHLLSLLRRLSGHAAAAACVAKSVAFKEESGASWTSTTRRSSTGHTTAPSRFLSSPPAFAFIRDRFSLLPLCLLLPLLVVVVLLPLLGLLLVLLLHVCCHGRKRKGRGIFADGRRLRNFDEIRGLGVGDALSAAVHVETKFDAAFIHAGHVGAVQFAVVKHSNLRTDLEANSVHVKRNSNRARASKPCHHCSCRHRCRHCSKRLS